MTFSYKNHKFSFKSSRKRIFKYTNTINGETTKAIINPTYPYGSRDNYIIEIFMDKYKVFWVGLFISWVSLVDLNRKNILHYKKHRDDADGFIDNNIREIIEDKNGICWIGTRSHGITKWDRKNNTYTHYQHNDKSKNTLVSNEIRELYIDKAGFLWIGTKKVLDRFNPATGQFQNIMKGKSKDSKKWVFDVIEDHRENIWMASFVKLYKYNQNVDYLLIHDKKAGVLVHDALRFVLEDSKNNIWTGSETGGVTRL